MNSPLERAQLLDAEMRLQRAWLDLSLREMSSEVRSSPWATLHALNIGKLGMSVLKHRSIWIAALSLLVNFYRRRKER
jgi:hypothetical protein